MTEERIVKIYFLHNVCIYNEQTKSTYRKNKIICVDYANGTTRYIDYKGGLDFTDVEFLTLKVSKKFTRIGKVLFDEEERLG